MREIKFRILKNEDDYKAWKDITIDDFIDNELFLSSKVYNKETLSQFTGLKDKNGREIYEGDIVKYRTHPMKTSKGIVVWSKNEPALKILDDHIYYSLGSINMIEVIGNIFENPEFINHPLT